MLFFVSYRIHLIFSAHLPTKTIRNILVINIAENKEIKIPSAKVNANPLINEVATKNNIAQTIKELKFESRIEGHALLNPSSIDCDKLFPDFISSFILAKIKMFASTAIPIERINPPMPAKVKVTGINLNIAKVSAT